MISGQIPFILKNLRPIKSITSIIINIDLGNTKYYAKFDVGIFTHTWIFFEIFPKKI